MVQALRVRRVSRYHLVKDGDLPVKFFFRYLSGRSKTPPIRHLDTEGGSTLEHANGIREEFYRFFVSLLSSEDLGYNINNYLFSTVSNKLSLEEKERVCRDIKRSEIKDAVKKLAKGKSPRFHRIPNEFYQKLWEVIEVDLVCAI